jgi:hypothetical protein
MPTAQDMLMLVAAPAAGVALIFILRWRQKSHVVNIRTMADEQVCPHLRPAYDLLLSRGHVPVNMGQKHPDLPLEIHLGPPFEPRQVYDELKLTDPVFVSERNVLYCKEDWCELHPKKR